MSVTPFIPLRDVAQEKDLFGHISSSSRFLDYFPLHHAQSDWIMGFLGDTVTYGCYLFFRFRGRVHPYFTRTTPIPIPIIPAARMTNVMNGVPEFRPALARETGVAGLAGMKLSCTSCPGSFFEGNNPVVVLSWGARVVSFRIVMAKRENFGVSAA